MAQAFNSVDTLLAPFIKADDLSYQEVKQCVQSLVFGLNISSRWGCVPVSTQIATPNGFKYYNELNVGDEICTFVDGKIRTARLQHILYKKNESGILHKYVGKNYVQTVTPEHRCVYYDETANTFKVMYSSELIKKNKIKVPYFNGDFEYGEITLVDVERVEGAVYDDYVWCPTTEDGTAIYKDADGNIFISGNSQPPFTNFSFDWTVPDDLAELNCIVGGKEVDFKYKDCKREMDMFNRAFMEVMMEGDSNGRGFSYPIPTYSITKDFDWDEEIPNNKLLFEMTAKYGIPYFSNFINSDMSPQDARSMCPLHKNEHVLVRDKLSREFHISEIGNLYNSSNSDYTYDIILNGRIKQARVHKFTGLDFYRVTTVNGYSVVLSGNHMNLVLGNKIKQTHELTESDYLPFNVDTLGGTGLSFDDGFVVGAFLGDGSFRDKYTVVFSLNDTTKAETLAKIIDISVKKFGAKVKTNQCTDGIGDHGCINLCVISKYMRGLIEEYVDGHATDKKLNVKAITRSEEFRHGIIDGYMATDGGNKNRIYTASVNAVESVTTLFESLGIPCRISVDNRDSSKKLSDNPIYAIRPYDMQYNKSQYKDVFIKCDGYMWFKIKSIERIDSSDSVGYCFEVLDDDTPYFMLPSGLVTHNCRLRLSLRELRKKNGGYFGSGDNTGSIGVVTINLPRLAYKSKSEEDFYKGLEKLMDIAARSLDIKRKVVTQHFENGLYPYSKRYLKSFDDHFSTIATVGMNEACLNACWIRDTIASDIGHEFANNVLEFMRNKLSDYQEKYGCLFNLESAPAESTSGRFAMHDKKDYPDIITAGDTTDGAPYYTNSSNLPVGYTDDIFEALDHQDDLQTKYTGGTVFHAFLGEKLPDWKSAMKLTRKIAENYKLPYFTFSPTYSICQDHGYITGEEWTCPICGKPTEVYSRVTGYYRAVQNFNDGKAHEFRDRKEYKMKSSDFDSVGSTQIDAPTQENCESATLNKPTLFTTSSCPNCKMARQYLDDHGFDYDVIVADINPDLALALGIEQAPTLVLPNGDRFENVSNIIKFIDTAMKTE